MFVVSTKELMYGCADALAQLAKDLSSPSNADREVAISMLSNLTIYLEHHDALRRAGVFPALLRAVLDANTVPQALHRCLDKPFVFCMLTCTQPRSE
jgi:hypothetical protein